tara:strand:- start:705 stop:1157 length:453 start_codon:yes stop_codon:yes gene_type:complete
MKSIEVWMSIDPSQNPTLHAEGGEDAMTLDEKQAAVGGLIEYCTFAENVQLPVPTDAGMRMATVLNVIANEEGRLMNLETNQIGTYAAFGVPIGEAPFLILGNVLLHVRIDEDAALVTPQTLMQTVMGIRRSHMIPSLSLAEADYTLGDE